MNKQERDQYKDTRPVAVYPMSNWGGLEIIAIEYGINDFVVYRENFGLPERLHRAVVRIDKNDRSFFIYNSTRIHLDQCMKCQ